MKHTRSVLVPQTWREVVERVTCDMCGAEIKGRTYGDAEEIEVKHRTGTSYPEGGSGEETSVDLCGKCFDERLIPWLRAQGAEPLMREWDF